MAVSLEGASPASGQQKKTRHQDERPSREFAARGQGTRSSNNLQPEGPLQSGTRRQSQVAGAGDLNYEDLAQSGGYQEAVIRQYKEVSNQEATLQSQLDELTYVTETTEQSVQRQEQLEQQRAMLASQIDKLETKQHLLLISGETLQGDNPVKEAYFDYKEAVTDLFGENSSATQNLLDRAHQGTVTGAYYDPLLKQVSAIDTEHLAFGSPGEEQHEVVAAKLFAAANNLKQLKQNDDPNLINAALFMMNNNDGQIPYLSDNNTLQYLFAERMPSKLPELNQTLYVPVEGKLHSDGLSLTMMSTPKINTLLNPDKTPSPEVLDTLPKNLQITLRNNEQLRDSALILVDKLEEALPGNSTRPELVQQELYHLTDTIADNLFGLSIEIDNFIVNQTNPYSPLNRGSYNPHQNKLFVHLDPFKKRRQELLQVPNLDPEDIKKYLTLELIGTLIHESSHNYQISHINNESLISQQEEYKKNIEFYNNYLGSFMAPAFTGRTLSPWEYYTEQDIERHVIENERTVQLILAEELFNDPDLVQRVERELNKFRQGYVTT